MNQKIRNLTQSALIAALYIVLTYAQNFLLPESTTMAIQYRVSEALCVLALFTPNAIGGLTIGCFLFNISNVGALPLDPIVGPLASGIAALGMWYSRKLTIKGFPLVSMIMPAVSNGILVGWELALIIGGGFWLNSACVAAGELAVLFTLGSVLYYVLRSRGHHIFRS